MSVEPVPGTPGHVGVAPRRPPSRPVEVIPRPAEALPRLVGLRTDQAGPRKTLGIQEIDARFRPSLFGI